MKKEAKLEVFKLNVLYFAAVFAFSFIRAYS
jgi:hypothetical protein